jgi:NAD(P)-dependent dehydrogenase (short-subunit alcohol dehydrogenase family)
VIPAAAIDLRGKTVVVTGGTQGLGEAVARFAAACGASGLTICGRNRARGEAVRRALEDAGAAALYVEADLGREEDCRAVVRAHEARFGGLDGLVNVAASTARGTLDSTTAAEWDVMFALNVRAPFLLMQEAVRLMKRARAGGSVVNVSSVSAHGGQTFLLAYSTSKGALNILTKNAAHALRADRVRVNALNIGWMSTPNEHAIQLAGGQPDNWLEAADRAQPFGRILRPGEVAKLVGWLLSDDAALMTGSILDYDQTVVGARE